MDTKSVLERFKKRKSATRELLFNVVGVTFENRQEKLKRLYEQYKNTKKYPNCFLLLDDKNAFDKNAIAVCCFVENKYECLGYISKNYNLKVREFFDNICSINIQEINCKSKNTIFYMIISVVFENLPDWA